MLAIPNTFVRRVDRGTSEHMARTRQEQILEWLERVGVGSYASGSNEYESEWFKQFFIHAEHPRLPLMRPAQPEEIAEAVLFFANPRNSYCTGSTLAVDGGLTIKF